MKTVVVTGASSGIGLGSTEAYLKKGFNVVANARTEERLKKAAHHLGLPSNLLPVAGDIGLKPTAERVVQEAVAKVGQVDILINNAGIFNAKPEDHRHTVVHVRHAGIFKYTAARRQDG